MFIIISAKNSIQKQQTQNKDNASNSFINVDGIGQEADLKDWIRKVDHEEAPIMGTFLKAFLIFCQNTILLKEIRKM